MAGLIAAIVLLSAALAVVTILYLIQRHRVRKLAAQTDEFLVSNAEPLAFSVREDALAPLHNSIAELENHYLLAREQQTAESRRTTHLISDISHQLKTPLASLRLFCEMDASEHVEPQLAQIERMERLIYALLRLERLCADGYAFRFAESDVREIVLNAWRNVETIWPDRVLEITGEAIIRCDAKWLGEAFLNLLKNACEHTPPNSRIIVRMETTQAAFFCTVEDAGGGVSASDLPHLFERFYRAEGQPNGGSGLGLAIAREIIQRHHGSIRAENAECGLRVSIDIPILNLAKS